MRVEKVGLVHRGLVKWNTNNNEAMWFVTTNTLFWREEWSGTYGKYDTMKDGKR